MNFEPTPEHMSAARARYRAATVRHWDARNTPHLFDLIAAARDEARRIERGEPFPECASTEAFIQRAADAVALHILTGGDGRTTPETPAPQWWTDGTDDDAVAIAESLANALDHRFDLDCGQVDVEYETDEETNEAHAVIHRGGIRARPALAVISAARYADLL